MCVCVLMNEVYACFTFAMQIRRMLMGVILAARRWTHVPECVFLGLYKAHAHGAARQCMHVSECAFWVCARRMLTVIAARRCMHVEYARIGAIMPTCIYTHRCDHAHTYMHT